MRKTAAKGETTTNDPMHDEVQQFIDAEVAKTQFLTSTMNMSWRLLVTVVIPIVAGVKIDEHFNTTPSFTLLGFMIATVAGCTVVWNTVKQVNREQAQDDVKSKKTKRRIKRA
jgi:F0F1-type ATP synthase assembly protein I